METTHNNTLISYVGSIIVEKTRKFVDLQEALTACP